MRWHLPPQPVVSGRTPFSVDAVVGGGLGKDVAEDPGESPLALDLGEARRRVIRVLRLLGLRHRAAPAVMSTSSNQVASNFACFGAHPVVAVKWSELTRSERANGSALAPARRLISGLMKPTCSRPTACP